MALTSEQSRGLRNAVAVATGPLAVELGLAGVPVLEIGDVREAENTIERLLDSDARVVIVEETLRSRFSEWFNNRLNRHVGLPLVIFCPTFAEEDAATDAYINRIVKPAVGFEIRLD